MLGAPMHSPVQLSLGLLCTTKLFGWWCSHGSLAAACTSKSPYWLLPTTAQVGVRDVGLLDLSDALRVAEDGVGDALGRRLAAAVVELDAPVLLRARPGCGWRS